MGFDNECILNIQSLPGEYFCPVCRTLVCPNEAMQTQCTHLYCKPCLAYIVATTQACPYDGYLVTEADSKPLMASNKPLSETIGKVAVHCQYHKSGCQWRGNLSDCITHGTTCAYGNSPVVCNRCSTQIVHRQVQEHAQLCPGLQPQAQAPHVSSGMTQSSAAGANAAMQNPSTVASAVPMTPVTTAPTTLQSTTTARPGTAAATVGSAGATTASTMGVAPSLPVAPTAASQGQAVAPQTLQTEQYQQQLPYQQYYQQQYPGYNPYMQQYQHGQYQQYTQPQMQIAPPSLAQSPVQSAPYAQPQVLQPNQAQHMMPFQSQNQPHLPQLQALAVQPQSQQHPPVPPVPQSQIPQVQSQNQIPQQPQPQPTTHTQVNTQVGSQPFAVPSSQATPSEVQPYVQPQIRQHHQVMAQHQQPQQHLPQQQHPPVQQQSYPQMQPYHQRPPMPHAQPQNPSVHAVTGHQSYTQPQPGHQQQGAPLQHSLHASQQQMTSAAQHHALGHPSQAQLTLQGQQPAMIAQGTQHTPQHQHVGHHPQRPEIHATVPPQAAPQGFPLNTPALLQTGQSYQQGMPSSQQQIHAPLQSQGQQFMQQDPRKSMNYVAPPEQFQNRSGGPVKVLQEGAMSQQPPMRMTSNNVAATSESHGAGQPFGQGSSSSLKVPASEAEKSENATNGTATGNTKVSGKKGSAESALVNRTAFDGSDGSDKGKGKGKGKVDFAAWESNSHGPDVWGLRGIRSDVSNDLVKGGSLQQKPQQNAAALRSYVAGMGPQHLYESDFTIPQHMRQPGHTPYMQGLPNQMRPPKHSFPENIRPPMQQPYEIAPRVLGPNPNQIQVSQPIRPDSGMIRPPMGPSLPAQHDPMAPLFAPEHVGQSHSLGTRRDNSGGGGSHGGSSALFEGGFDSSEKNSMSFAAYLGRNNVGHKDFEENTKQFLMPTHLDGEGPRRGPRRFEGGLGRPDGFADSLSGRPFTNHPGPFPIGFGEDYPRKPSSAVSYPDIISPGAEFGQHGIDGMPVFRNPGPFFQGMTGAPGGLHKDQLGSSNIPGDGQYDFDNSEFPHTRFHPGDTFLPRNMHRGWGGGQLHGIEPSDYGYRGHMHADDPNLPIDYPYHFGLGGHLRNEEFSWCRICNISCGTVENLNIHVETREHQHHAMDIVLKMKQDDAKRRKMKFGGPKSSKKKVMLLELSETIEIESCPYILVKKIDKFRKNP
uniref:RING-type domain-containing protein n=1 Tax=Leersia perrieri TaxID=77586 RepID=A0A0D9XX14_9ORYZ